MLNRILRKELMGMGISMLAVSKTSRRRVPKLNRVM
jgi:hypothetical protein